MKGIKQIGTDSSNFIGGTVGNESIWSVAGWDTLYGYSDNDLLVGGTGGDHINGQAANNSLYLIYSIFYKITILLSIAGLDHFFPKLKKLQSLQKINKEQKT